METLELLPVIRSVVMLENSRMNPPTNHIINIQHRWHTSHFFLWGGMRVRIHTFGWHTRHYYPIKKSILVRDSIERYQKGKIELIYETNQYCTEVTLQ